MKFHLHSAGHRMAFAHPETGEKFAQIAEAGRFAAEQRNSAAAPGEGQGFVYKKGLTKDVDLVVVPDAVAGPLPAVAATGKPWQHFGAFLRGEPLAGAAPPGHRVHPQQRKFEARARAQAGPPAPRDAWDVFAEAFPALLNGVPLPNHRAGEDLGWGDEDTRDVPPDLLGLGREAWALVALVEGALQGAFLPRWGNRLLDERSGEGPWDRLWSWATRRRAVLIFLELGEHDGCCYAFNLNAPESLRAMYQTLAWTSGYPESFTLYRQHRVLGFSPPRIREAYARDGNCRFGLDAELHERGQSLCGDARMLSALTKVNGFALDRVGFHRFFSSAPEGSASHIRTLLPRLAAPERAPAPG